MKMKGEDRRGEERRQEDRRGGGGRLIKNSRQERGKEERGR